MSDYPEEFEKIWKQRVPSRLSGRKEAGFVVYSRMTKEITQLKEQLAEAESVLQVNLEDENWAYMTVKEKLLFGLEENQAIRRRELRVKGVLLNTRERIKEYFTKYKKQES